MSNGISIVIRALNEEALLGTCLEAIDCQQVDRPVEVILVDSGSTDGTVEIAKAHGCRIVTLPRQQFSFGRALNLGVAQARHDMVVSISAHCVPVGRAWLSDLVRPLVQGMADITYGAHRASPESRTSEINYFATKFCGSSGPVTSPLMNNGNAAFHRSLWCSHAFDEELPAQEDIAFCLWHMRHGKARLHFVAEALVTHHHNDRNHVLYRRLFREMAVEFHLGQRKRRHLLQFLARMPLSIAHDFNESRKRGTLRRAAKGILAFRAIQAAAFWQAARHHTAVIHGRR